MNKTYMKKTTKQTLKSHVKTGKQVKISQRNQTSNVVTHHQYSKDKKYNDNPTFKIYSYICWFNEIKLALESIVSLNGINKRTFSFFSTRQYLWSDHWHKQSPVVSETQTSNETGSFRDSSIPQKKRFIWEMICFLRNSRMLRHMTDDVTAP